MAAEASSFTAEVVTELQKKLQSWWEIPSTAQYISLFRKSFNLPEIEIEELEKGFIDDTVSGPSTWLQKLILAFLKSIMPGRVNAENWEDQLRKLIKRKLSVGEENPFEEDKAFHELKIRSKVEIVYSLCLHRLDRNDIPEQMKSMQADSLRVQMLGSDEDGNNYWYFYGTRLYKEETDGKKKSWNEEWKEQKQKSLKKRGRGRPRKHVQKSDGESDSFEDFDPKKNDGYMNVDEKSRWSVVCDSMEEWVNFAEKFKKSKSKKEISIFKAIQENFLPVLNVMYEEKEKKLQQKIKELMPLPIREKIVTRRETRRMRGENVDYSYVNGYYSDDDEKVHIVKNRAQRLEERNKRASDMDCVQMPSRNRRGRNLSPSNAPEHEDENEYKSSLLSKSESSEVDWPSQMERLLSSIKLHKDAWPFLYPVNEDDVPGYYDIIHDPIDLSTIETRLFEGHYDSVQDLDDDFSKLVSNCISFNGEHHEFSKMVQPLRKMFRDGVAKILNSIKSSEFADSEGSRDSMHSSSSNSVSSHGESRGTSSKGHRKSKDRKKRKRKMEALSLLAEASDLAVQDNFVNRTSPPRKKSSLSQQIQAVLQHVPSTNMPYSPPSTTASSNTIQTSPPVTNSNVSPPSNFMQRPKKDKPIIIRAKEIEKRTSPTQNITTTSFNTISSTNSINSVSQNNMYQPISPKTIPLVISGYNQASHPSQSDLRFKNNPGTAVTMQSNVCMPNGLPVMQQVLYPANQQIQVPNGQLVFASPQNTVRLFNKEQNVQILNNANQGFGKVMPHIVTSAPVMQVHKEVMPGLQFQAVSENNTQTFTQVTQNPQFVSIPTYMLTNQNTIGDSSQQSMVNLQAYQIPQRQMHISSQGNC